MAAGRRDLLGVQLSSDLTLGFNATFRSPAHSSRFLCHSLGASRSPRRALSTQPACLAGWLQLKGKCSSGEVRYFHHKVPVPTMWPGPTDVFLLRFSSSSLPVLHNTSLYFYPPLWPHPERLIEGTSGSKWLLCQTQLSSRVHPFHRITLLTMQSTGMAFFSVPQNKLNYATESIYSYTEQRKDEGGQRKSSYDYLFL